MHDRPAEMHERPTVNDIYRMMVPYYPLQVTRIIDKSLTQFCVDSTVLSMKDGGPSPSEVCQWPESG